jgi:lanosterol synthase
MSESEHYDVAIIGGGPAGCTAALAFAERGAKVSVFEANPRAAGRLAGEWLHPPAVEILRRLRVDLSPVVDYPTGRGFVVFPEDGSEPILLAYPGGKLGLSLPHERLVRALREAVIHRAIEYHEGARATLVDGQTLEYRIRDSATASVHADLIVGASGRAGVSRRMASVMPTSSTCSRMAAALLDVHLPFEGYGHVFFGAPGPILLYRISPQEVRMCLDLPISLSTRRDARAVLFEAYSTVLPPALRDAFRRSLAERDVEWATNQTSSRGLFGRPGFALVGDAVGHHHPLTAVGLTLGIQDAMALARSESFTAYEQRRRRASRVPEVLATALYDIFSGASDESVAMRRAIYAMWRQSTGECNRTMRLLSCEAVGVFDFGAVTLKILGRAAGDLALQAGRGRSDALSVGSGIGSAVQRWLGPEPVPRGDVKANGSVAQTKGRRASSRLPSSNLHVMTIAPRSETPTRSDASHALELGMRALLAEQDEDGSWEGECIWCALLAAEYVLTWHLVGKSIPEARRRRILLHFERTRLQGGLWGLSEIGQPSLFVTTLVYVAARTLGLPANHDLLRPARAFFANEGGVLAIPTWGKFWLALLSLYRWEGVNPIAPELWAMPSWLPLHPSRYYCHTRLIYMAMAVLYAERVQAPATNLTIALRSELFPQGFEHIDFRQARNRLRREDLWEEPSLLLRLGYDVLQLVDRTRPGRGRAKLLDELRALIRWELRSTNHTAISPVSGLLDILALRAEDPNDPDAAKAVEQFDCWVWEDDQDGFRVAGARSAIWDTSFALQAIRVAPLHDGANEALRDGVRFLESQQIRTTFTGYRENHRTDPRGGYPVSWAWHGWPVSDCTAEAILCRLEAGDAPDEDVISAAKFILRSQGADGGFGSYEAKRVPFSIEWLNPAEMFGDSMAETGYVECTASCVAALAKIAAERPHLLRLPELSDMRDAIARGAHAIRRRQLSHGPWPGAWGVRFIYGTWFGVRGLVASGAPPTDPSVRKACRWLKGLQRPDGSWGERLDPHADDYVAHEVGQVVQTAWALLTLAEACDPDFSVLDRAARFLARSQLGNGQWPRQDPHGLFHRTARLEYSLYRSYFPLWALAKFEARRVERRQLTGHPAGPPALELHRSGA